MRIDRNLAHNLILVLGLAFTTEAMAQSSSVNFHIGFSGHVDCDQPIQMRDIPISGDGVGVLNTDGSASADLTQTAFILSTRIHFEGRLGGAPKSAPGGTAQVRVAGRHRLLLIWNLPNNQLIVDIAVSGQSCSALEPRPPVTDNLPKRVERGWTADEAALWDELRAELEAFRAKIRAELEAYRSRNPRVGERLHRGHE
jgi:hypothetical protein